MGSCCFQCFFQLISKVSVPAALTHPAGMELRSQSSISSTNLSHRQSCKPTDLGSSKSLSPKLTQLCPILSKGDPMPAYGANTPFARCYSFQNKQVYGHAAIPSIQNAHGKTQPAAWPAPPPLAPQAGCRSVTISRATLCIPTAQLCQPLPPVQLWPPPPRPLAGREGPGMAWILVGFAAPWQHQQARLPGCCCIPQPCAG